jgi:UDP-glucose 4-epimerase
VVDDLSTGRRINVAAGVDLTVCDLADGQVIVPLLRGCDVVFHLAARGSVQRSVEQPMETDRVNVGGTLSLLCAALQAGVRRVVLSSSSSVYGGLGSRPTIEDAPTRPRSPYAVGKLAGEHYARVFAELHGLETVCLRYFNVFGPRQRSDSAYAAVVPRFVDALLHGRQPELHGDGAQTRDFTYVADAVQANLLAATAPADACSGRVYNIARGEPHAVSELLTVLCGLIGVEPDPRYTEVRPGDVRHSHASIEAAARDLGFRPQVAFADGLAATVDWARSSSWMLAGATPT